MRFSRATWLFLSSAASNAYAQTRTTLPVFDLFLNEGGNLSGAVISANPSTTALRVGCAGPTASDCSGSPPIYITKINGNTWQGSAYPDPAFTYTFSCVVAPSAAPSLTAVCYTSAGGSEANFPGAATETYPGDSTSTVSFAPVVITEGAQKLLAASATASSSSSGSRRLLFSDSILSSYPSSTPTQTSSVSRSSGTTTASAQSASSAAAAPGYIREGIVIAAVFVGGLAML